LRAWKRGVPYHQPLLDKRPMLIRKAGQSHVWAWNLRNKGQGPKRGATRQSPSAGEARTKTGPVRHRLGLPRLGRLPSVAAKVLPPEHLASDGDGRDRSLPRKIKAEGGP